MPTLEMPVPSPDEGEGAGYSANDEALLREYGFEPDGGSDPDVTSAPADEAAERPFQFTDRRKIDPISGQVREPVAKQADEEVLASLDFAPDPEVVALPPVGGPTVTEPTIGASAEAAKAKAEAAANLDALQRERAAFTNYRNRAQRDQETAHTKGVESVLEALFPVLDDLSRARDAGELDGPMLVIAQKLDDVLAKFGIERYGEVGEEFDPTVHDALMHRADPGAGDTEKIEMLIDHGYRIGDRVVRPARVGVVGPE